MRLAARVAAFAAACGALALAGMPPASASAAASVATSVGYAATGAATGRASAASTAVAAVLATSSDPAATRTAPNAITLTEITPPVVRPGQGLVIAGTVDLALLPEPVSDPANLSVRVVRNRTTTLPSRAEVADWAESTAPTPGTELIRRPLAGGPSSAVPFRLEVAAVDVRVTRAFGVIQLAVEVLSPRGTTIAATHTFAGWHRSDEFTSLSLAWLLPLTLTPDAELLSDQDKTRIAAWDKQIGSGSRLDALLRATASAPVGYAVDPALLGPAGWSAAERAADPLAGSRTALTQALGSALVSGHEIFALPYADPDLTTLTEPGMSTQTRAAADELLGELVSGSTALAARGISAQATLAWPVDGDLPAGREELLRAAYGSRLDAVLVSAEVTDPTARLTPPTSGTAPLGTTVLRWDDRLGALLGRLDSPRNGLLAQQEFIAQTVALLGERPSITRTHLVAPPRGFDVGVDPAVLSRFLEVAGGIPWLRTVPLTRALQPGTGPDATLPLQVRGDSDVDPALTDTAAKAEASRVADIAVLDRILAQRSAIGTLAKVLAPESRTVARWTPLPAQLVSSRGRADPPARDRVLGALESSTAATVGALRITPQTTNFLADEGFLQLTVVNGLNEPVHGIRAVLQPGNGRIVVADPGEPFDIAARAKATVSVRLSVLAQGLVPVTAWLTTTDGTRLGPSEQLTIRAAPPGAWLYVGLGALVALVLVGGIVRAVKRPPRLKVDTLDLDPVDPTPEEPLLEPVERHPAT